MVHGIKHSNTKEQNRLASTHRPRFSMAYQPSNASRQMATPDHYQRASCMYVALGVQTPEGMFLLPVDKKQAPCQRC